MGHDQQEWRLRVLAGDDTLRRERLTRDLYDDLLRADGVGVRFAEEEPPPAGGRKGGSAGDVALWAAVGAAGGQATRILVTLIKEWSARERHRKIEITYRGHSVTITGSPDEAQERLIREFLDRSDGESGPE
ncbi:hypothetical protein GWI34_14605 [Actinomadura sp. DSM 109109]|nr:hypothetical protein [Actinomadura lepetitiana]